MRSGVCGVGRAACDETGSAEAVPRERDAKAHVDDAFARNCLSPATADWATAQCLSDPDSFDLFIDKAISQFTHLFRPAATSATPPDLARAETALGGSVEEIGFCEQIGLNPGALRD